MTNEELQILGGGSLTVAVGLLGALIMLWGRYRATKSDSEKKDIENQRLRDQYDNEDQAAKDDRNIKWEGRLVDEYRKILEKKDREHETDRKHWNEVVERTNTAVERLNKELGECRARDAASTERIKHLERREQELQVRIENLERQILGSDVEPALGSGRYRQPPSNASINLPQTPPPNNE